MAKGYLEPLAIKLAIGAIILVVGTLAPAFYYLADRHYRGLLELKEEESLAHGDLIRTILEHEMLEGNLDLVRQLVERYSDDPSSKRIMLLDHLGRVRFSNDPSVRGRTFSRASPACQVCHEKAPAERESSALVELSHGTILRGVYPVRNREACHACHGPSIDINGVVITDTNISRMQAELRADTRNMAVAVAAVALALLAGMGLIVRRLVLRRLQKIVTSARAIGAGDFSRRVDIGGDDALARLGSEFNAMADATNNLLNQLHDHRTQLENVMNSVDDGLLVLDDTFTVVAANRAAAQRVDAPREQLLFRRCRDLWGEQCVCGSSGADERCPSQRCFESGRSQTAFVTRIDADGVERQEEVSVSPVFAHDGRVTQVVEVWRDITERRSHEARMAEFQRLASVGTLASGFSHEVNTPLGTVLLCVDDITGRIETRLPDATDEIRGQLRLIRDEILRCRALTQQFLQLSKGQSLKRDLVEIRALVGNTIPLVEHIAKDAEVAVRILPSGEVGLVSANPGAAQQVLLNLLLNAVQASAPGGEVRVSWGFNGSVVVRVEDDGVGMPVEVRRNIFEPFYSRRPSGTGLGLFVSINLARHWGGDIRVDSRPGRGSRFEVTFPHQDSQ